jgi:hypothetical protein
VTLSVDQARQQHIAQLLRQGLSQRAIGAALDPPVTGARVNQLIHDHPWLRRLQLSRGRAGFAGTSGMARLQALRRELAEIQAEVASINRQVRAAVRELDQEIEILAAHLAA